MKCAVETGSGAMTYVEESVNMPQMEVKQL
jgi:hypothetical protein